MFSCVFDFYFVCHTQGRFTCHAMCRETQETRALSAGKLMPEKFPWGKRKSENYCHKTAQQKGNNLRSSFYILQSQVVKVFPASSGLKGEADDMFE